MSTQIVPGSLQALAQQSGHSLAESFLSADAIVLVDVSGSMSDCDVRHRPGQSRYDVACSELAKLQAQLPGKVAVIAFSDSPTFCPGGVPSFDRGGTNLAGALRFVHIADDCGITFYVISDGQPNDEASALAEARKFKSTINTIFIGNEGDSGADFLRRLAQASGGKFEKNSVAQLADSVQRLMLTAGAA